MDRCKNGGTDNPRKEKKMPSTIALTVFYLKAYYANAYKLLFP